MCVKKQESISYGIKVSKKRKFSENLVLYKLSELKQLLVENPKDKKIDIQYEKTKAEWEKIHKIKCRGAMVRSRFQWIQEGEKNTSFFLSLEKSRAVRKVINCLELDDGTRIENHDEIMLQIYNYYSDLFAKEKTESNDILTENVKQFCKDIHIPSLSESEKFLCEGLFTKQECLEVVRSMKDNKSPGIDGLWAEFYKVFWDVIGDLVVNALNYSFVNSQLSISQRRAVLTLIPKGSNLPGHYLKNYRPIALTCCDYKIGAGILAKRLQRVIKSIINFDQTGYIKGRGIHYNLRMIQDIIWYTEREETEGILLALDFSKAFDSISVEYILECLSKFNFGPEFIKWVKIFCSKRKSCVSNSGWHTDWFNMYTGVRQGCPLSALLFVLATEILACRLRSSNKLAGISIKGCNREIKLSLFADDITVFLRDTKSVYNLIHEIDKFSSISNLRLNKDKTKAMWLGKWAERDDELAGLNFVQELKILGVLFRRKGDLSEIDSNWTVRIENISKIIQLWQKHDLSLVGKVQVVKSLLISQFVQVLTVARMPSAFVKEVNSLIFKFIWQKNQKGIEKVKRNIMIQPISLGGVGMVDINLFNQALIGSWAQRFSGAGSIENNWTLIPNWIFGLFGENCLILKYNCYFDNIASLFDKNIPLFYKELLKLTLNFNHSNSVSKSDVIFHNLSLCYKGNCLFFPDWLKYGIMYVGQVVDENNRFISYNQVKQLVKEKGCLMFQYNALKQALS